MKMKSLAVCLIAVVLMFGLAVSVHAEYDSTQPITLVGTVSDSSTATLKAGSSFTVSVALGNAPDLGILNFILSYDSSLLKCTATDPGSPNVLYDDNAGRITYSREETTDSDLNGVVMTATFEVQNTTSASDVTATLDLMAGSESKYMYANTDNKYYTAEFSDVSLTIQHVHSDRPEGNYTDYLEDGSLYISPDTEGYESSAMVLTDTSKPNCTEAGTQQYTCAYCGEAIVDETPIAALGHQVAADAEPTAAEVAATCTGDGTRAVYKCSACDAEVVSIAGEYVTKTEDNGVIEATGHLAENVTHYDAKASTTKTYGYYEYWYCSACGQYFKADPTGMSDTTAEDYPGTYTVATAEDGTVDYAASVDTNEDGTYLYLPLANYKLGDVDGDGDITAYDVLLIKKFRAKMTGFTEFYNEDTGEKISDLAADVDADSDVTAFDVLMIKKYRAGILGYETLEDAYDAEKAAAAG